MHDGDPICVIVPLKERDRIGNLLQRSRESHMKVQLCFINRMMDFLLSLLQKLRIV